MVKNKIAVAATFSVIALMASSANAKFVSTGEKFESKILSEKNVEVKEYKRCNSKVLAVNEEKLADDYESALAKDPMEGFNRAMHKFNHAIDKAAIKPVAKGYRYAVPQWGRDRVSGVFNNLEEPRNFANSILQMDTKAALTAGWRFIINSTFGIAGMHDVAGGFGLKEKDKDFSTTLAYYGIGTGPYIVAPVLGPSTVRDLAGKGVDSAADITNYAEGGIMYSKTVGEGISKREKIMDVTDDLEKDSFDLYSSYKSGYLQNRKKAVQKSLERD
jgi:phospholipid-binding lipoprotein MlaA